MVWIQNQLVGSAIGQKITLECQSEAYPKSINYWMKNDTIITLGKAAFVYMAIYWATRIEIFVMIGIIIININIDIRESLEGSYTKIVIEKAYSRIILWINKYLKFLIDEIFLP